MLMFEWILVLLLAAVILTNLAERLAVPYPSLLAIAGVGLASLLDIVGYDDEGEEDAD
jgi:monovalent cation/hydrogen antiporter